MPFQSFPLQVYKQNSITFRVEWAAPSPYFSIIGWAANFNVYPNSSNLTSLLSLTSFPANGISIIDGNTIAITLDSTILQSFNSGSFYYELTYTDPANAVHDILSGSFSVSPGAGPYVNSQLSPSGFPSSGIAVLQGLTVDTFSSGNAQITGGTIDDAIIGSVTPSSATFTTIYSNVYRGLVGVSQPASGQTIVVPNNIDTLVIEGTVDLDSLTVTLPSAPIEGQKLSITTDIEIKSFNLQAATGQSISFSPSYMLQYSSFQLVLHGSIWKAVSASEAQFINGTFYDTALATATTISIPDSFKFALIEGSVTGATVGAQGDGFASTPAISISPPNNVNGVQATAVGSLSYSLAGATVTNGGTGYTNATVSIPAPTGINGIQAVATATITGGVITGIQFSNYGFGYLVAPSITITGDGTGATASAALSSTGSLNAITITNPGLGYDDIPTISVANTGTSQATATALISAGNVTLDLPSNPFNGQTLSIFFTLAIPSLTFSVPSNYTLPTNLPVSARKGDQIVLYHFNNNWSLIDYSGDLSDGTVVPTGLTTQYKLADLFGGVSPIELAPASTATTQTITDSSTKIATTAFVKEVVLGTGYTVATLPTGVPINTRAYVTDASSPAYLQPLTGGGTTFSPAVFNGTQWISG